LCIQTASNEPPLTNAQAAILNAKSLEEVQQLEMQLKAGVVPDKLEAS
jgi:hypothetical protein